MITVIILTHNEAKNLQELLPSLSFADRIIIIDDNSTDQTVVIAKKFKADVFVRELNHDFAAQRNFALSQVKSGWVLFLDADERPSQKLIEELKQIRTGTYAIKRIDVFSKRKLLYGETGNAWFVRFAPHDAGTWTGKVHEVWNLPEPQKLEGELLHYSHDSTLQLFKSASSYAQIRAKELVEAGEKWNLWQLLTYPTAKFAKNYLLKQGFRDGWRGWLMAIAMSWHSFLVRWFIWSGSFADLWLVFVVVTMALGQLTRMSFGSHLAVYPFEIGMMVYIALQLKHLTPCDIGKWRFTWWFSTVLAVSYGLSLLNRIGSPLSGLYVARWWVYGLFIIGLKQTKISIRGLILFLAASLVTGGWVQYLFSPDMRWLKYYGWDDHYYRMIGLIFDPNYFGLMLMLILIWSSFFLRRRFRLPVAMILISSMVATFSRTTYFLLITYGLTMKKTVIILLILAVVIWVTLPKPGGEGVNLLRKFSLDSRLSTMSQAWKIFLNSPLFGVGYNQYPYISSQSSVIGAEYHPSAPDNSFLFILATTGIVGFGAFILMLGEWFRVLNAAGKMSLGLILIHSLVNNSFFYPWVLLWIGLLLAESASSVTAPSNKMIKS